MPTLTLVRIDGNVQWKCFQGKGGNWIAVCDPLRLTIQSDTWNDLMGDIGQTLNALLIDLLTSNELDRFLREHGWNVVGPMPSRPENVRFDLPFFPAMMGANGPQRDVHK